MIENNVNQVFIQVETKNLVLRQICMDDKEDIFKQFSSCEVSRFLVDAEPFTSMEEAEKLINLFMRPEPRGHHIWVIIRKADNSFLGTCEYHNWDRNNNICDIGYSLSNDFWGKGYMTEALKGALKVGFENMGLNKIQGFVHLQNEKSINLLLRSGFKQEGIIRDKYLFRGNYYDHYCFSLLKREWQP